MRIVENILIGVLLHLFLFTVSSKAHIISLKLQSDSRHIIPFSDFEFSNVGYVSLFISSVTVTSDPSRIGFLLVTSDPSRIGFLLESGDVESQQKTTLCPLDFKLNSVLFTFQNLSQFSLFNKSFSLTDSGMKSFLLVNCNNESKSIVNMDGYVELYNMDVDGTTKNYLSAGLTQLPFLYLILSFIYLSFTGVWIILLFRLKRYFHMTHLLMGGLLVMSFFQFMCVVADLHYVKVTGSSNGLDVLFCIFQAIRFVLLTTVVLLIGTGWLFWKPVLETSEKLVLMIAILLEVWAHRDPLLPWEASVPTNKLDFIICCLFFFFPISVPSSFTSLLEKFDTDLYAPRSYHNLALLLVLVFVYVLITRVVVLGVSSLWGYYAVKETATLVFCMVMFYMYRPIDRTKFLPPGLIMAFPKLPIIEV